MKTTGSPAAAPAAPAAAPAPASPAPSSGGAPASRPASSGGIPAPVRSPRLPPVAPASTPVTPPRVASPPPTDDDGDIEGGIDDDDDDDSEESGSAAPPLLDARARAADPKAKPKRDPILHKHVLEDGTEVEVDLADALAGHKRRMKVDGQEVEVSIDDAFRSYERFGASMKRFEEAAKTKKDAEAMVSRSERREAAIKQRLSDPTQALNLVERVLGPELFYRAMSERIAERIQYEKLSPAERARVDKLRERESKIESVDAQLRRQKSELDQRTAQERAKADAEMQTRLQGQLTKELEEGGLPAAPLTISILARLRAAAARSKVSLSAEEAIAQVREELSGLVGGLSSDPTTLRKILGEKGTEAVRQSEIDLLNEQPGRRAPVARAPSEGARARPAPPARGPAKPRSLDDLRDHLRTQRGARRVG